jgi:predicted patatin/cPLA2 family phospholipase
MNEIINYSSKNQIYLKLLYSDSKNINSLTIGKNFPLAYNFLPKITKLSKDCKKNYTSQISKFLTISKLDKKKRVIVIFSDFLDLSELEKNDIKLLDINNNLYLFQVFCDLNF